MDRVAMLRSMLERNEPTDLFAHDSKSRSPWDLAAAREGTKAGAREAHAAGKGSSGLFDPKRVLSDIRIHVVDAVEQHDQVIMRWRLQGRWTHEFMGVKPSGQEVNISGSSTYYFRGDKIVAQDGDFDAPSFMAQARGSVSAEACERAMVIFARPVETESRTGG